jgi:hypothetical protein
MTAAQKVELSVYLSHVVAGLTYAQIAQACSSRSVPCPFDRPWSEYVIERCCSRTRGLIKDRLGIERPPRADARRVSVRKVDPITAEICERIRARKRVVEVELHPRRSERMRTDLFEPARRLFGRQTADDYDEA